MATVNLVDWTGAGNPDPYWAARVLVYTKATRLSDEDRMAVWTLPPEQLQVELEYMAKTIASSWEFCNVTFQINDITRAGFQQMSRTRFTPMEVDIFGAYAQQSQRVTDVSAMGWLVPESVPAEARDGYNQLMSNHLDDYEWALAHGVSMEDARGLLPMNLYSNAIVKYDLRALAELFRKRKSIRTQGEYRDIVQQMEEQVLQIWPWAETFFQPKHEKAIELLGEVIEQLKEAGDPWMPETIKLVAKAQDLIRDA